jgi:hypothetical protein
MKVALQYTGNQNPFSSDVPPFSVLLEAAGSNATHNQERLEQLAEVALEGKIKKKKKRNHS